MLNQVGIAIAELKRLTILEEPGTYKKIRKAKKGWEMPTMTRKGAVHMYKILLFSHGNGNKNEKFQS